MPPRLRILAIAALVAALSTAAAASLYAAGSSEPARPAGDARYEKARAAVTALDYRGAIPLLEAVVADQPKNADALNYLGYSHRKLGEFDKALVYYTRALESDPKHRGAHEYLGELYLQMGDLARAEAQLKRLDGLCFFGCDELDDLKAAIQEYRKKNAS